MKITLSQNEDAVSKKSNDDNTNWGNNMFTGDLAKNLVSAIENQKIEEFEEFKKFISGLSAEQLETLRKIIDEEIKKHHLFEEVTPR